MASTAAQVLGGIATKMGYATAAVELIKKGWKMTNALAARHPVVATILANLAFLSDELAAKIIADTAERTDTEIVPLDDLVRNLVVDDNLQKVLADSITKVVGYDNFVSRVPGKVSRAIPDKTKQVLRERFERRRKLLDSSAIVSYESEPTDQELAIQTMRVIGNYFGARSKRQIVELHSALRAFVNTSSEDVAETAHLIDIVR